MEAIQEVLNTLPEVRWDRYAQTQNQYVFYGWIKRTDKKFDFIVLFFVNDRLVSFVTSSKKYSSEYHTRLAFVSPHLDCRRVEDLFPQGEVNCIKLRKSS